MTMQKSSLNKTAALLAIVVGVGGGSYGIASAASGSGTTTSAVAVTAPATSTQPAGATGQGSWGHQRGDETLLTGDALAKVTAIAEAKVPGGTVVRVETDADGNSTYEAHMTKADGTPVTVYVDDGFAFVSMS